MPKRAPRFFPSLGSFLLLVLPFVAPAMAEDCDRLVASMLPDSVVKLSASELHAGRAKIRTIDPLGDFTLLTFNVENLGFHPGRYVTNARGVRVFRPAKLEKSEAKLRGLVQIVDASNADIAVLPEVEQPVAILVGAYNKSMRLCPCGKSVSRTRWICTAPCPPMRYPDGQGKPKRMPLTLDERNENPSDPTPYRVVFDLSKSFKDQTSVNP